VSYTSPTELIEAFAPCVSSEIEDEQIDLVRAALLIARTEYPALDIEAYAARVDQLAYRAAERTPGLDAGSAIATLNHVLFGEIGLRGNRDDYYDPRNSFLNDVLDRGLGIPITLSLVYMEVARRIGFPLAGIGLPGHFLLKHYAGDGQETLIDCFNHGEIVSPQECQTRLDEIYSGEMEMRPEFLHPISRRQILARMLNNLKAVYLSTRNFRKALPISDLILLLQPQSAEEVKQRALLRYSMNLHRLAGEDLEEYLHLSPQAPDAVEIRKMAVSIRCMRALMN
jgi:regulator of sirC expression with transglutaminase-like and TPR domain